MRLVQVNTRITELMAQFVAEVKGSTAMGMTDINKASETLLIPLLREVYGYKELQNLNYQEHSNFPAIDLGDRKAKVSIQITSTPSREKIINTLKSFVKHSLYTDYEKLRFYILSEKQGSYSTKGINQIIQDKFIFHPSEDILGYRDVLYQVSAFPIDRCQRVLDILESYFTKAGSTHSHFHTQIQGELRETIELNLLNVTFPNRLFIAEIIPNLSKEITSSKPKSGDKFVKRWKSKRELINDYLYSQGLKSAVDWETYENKLITFNDLEDDNSPLRAIIDQGTIETFSPEDFYSAGPSEENIFKSLLRKCLQQKLFSRRVIWQNEKHVFIFVDIDGEDERKEKWKNVVSAERTVFERFAKKDNPEDTWYFKHLAFQVRFIHLVDNWYLIIDPDWFFSFDRYRESAFAGEKVTWLKRQENNQHVRNHLRFIVNFLKNEPPPKLFDGKPQFHYATLGFGQLITFSNAPSLPDSKWRPLEPPEKQIDESQLSMDL